MTCLKISFITVIKVYSIFPFRYTNRLEAANLRASVGTTGNSYDNALAETVNDLYKTEGIEYLKSDWAGLADVELATLNWVD